MNYPIHPEPGEQIFIQELNPGNFAKEVNDAMRKGYRMVIGTQVVQVQSVLGFNERHYHSCVLEFHEQAQ